MIDCIINNKSVKTHANPGMVTLDYLRLHEHLTGTKEGCREGDCGACTILVGELQGNDVVYRSVNSCLMPFGDAHGKHIVTIEGINQPAELNPIQHAFVEDGGTQCGFCTPGFIMSLTGYCINNDHPDAMEAVKSVDGNICRCTGHPPIKKAIRHVVENLNEHTTHRNGTPLASLVESKIVPEYFLAIPQRLKKITNISEIDIRVDDIQTIVVSGGTDLYVQKAFTMHASPSMRISGWKKAIPISEDQSQIIIPGTATVEEFRVSPIMNRYFPKLKSQLELFGSMPIRNRATIAGNIVNASPIGDMTCLLLALNAELHLIDNGSKRSVPLRQFYKGYKQIDKKRSELIESITFSRPDQQTHLSYEKVSRRQYLDIASVNTTMVCSLNGDRLTNCSISAGGVGPIPLFLLKTSALLNGRSINSEVVMDAVEIAQSEISPISDARGSAEYKRLLLRQLIVAHFLNFFPEIVEKEVLT